MPQILTIQLSSNSTSPGPYNVYDYTNGILLNPSDPQSLPALQAGIQRTVSDTTTQISIVNLNPACVGKTIIKNVPPFASPSPTPSLTPLASATPTPTVTPTPTITPTATPSVTPTITVTPSITPSITPSPSLPQIAITVKLTIDPGNVGNVTLYTTGSSGIVPLAPTLTSNSQYTYTTVNGGTFWVSVFQTAKAYNYQMSTMYFYDNGVIDACSPYYQTALLAENKTYCNGAYPVAFVGHSYFIDVYIGNQR